MWNAKGEYDNVIVTNPADPSEVFFAGVGEPLTSGPWLSLNGGTTWTNVGLNAPNGDVPHVDYHSAAFDSNGNLDLIVTFPTPEPEHIMLMCVGVLLAGFAIRRRWQQRALKVVSSC